MPEAAAEQPIPADDVITLITPWMSAQRWFSVKNNEPSADSDRHSGFHVRGRWSFHSDDPTQRLETWLIADGSGVDQTLYQVPLVFRSESAGDAAVSGGALAAGDAGFIGRVGDSRVSDGAHDQGFTAALMNFILDGQAVDGNRIQVRGSSTGTRLGSGYTSRVLSGEQSNTSIIFERIDAKPVIIKLFRILGDGDNPDVVLQTALSEAGSTTIPTPLGFIHGDWHPDATAGRAAGHLAFAQEFLPGVQDAWRVALNAAAEGVDFSERAYALGVATAEVHGALADSMGSVEATPAIVDETVRAMMLRFEAARARAVVIDDLAPAIRDVLHRASTVPWPRQQRIHGDYHLGQVLWVEHRGWVLLDFEGEPMRSLAERNLPDSPLRDIAGMLRSFDYVGGALSMAGTPHRAEWSAEARESFERGYSAASGRDLNEDRALIDAFELDKALYETVYEASNRPDWLSIPVEAVSRLVRGVNGE